MGDRDEPMGVPASAGAAKAADAVEESHDESIVDTTAEAVAAVDGERERSGGSPEERVAALEAELAERREDLLRERAEVENFKRRMLREKSEALRFAAEPLVRDLLPVVDNLERALEHTGDATVVEGIKMVHKGLLDVLARNQVERIDAVGSPFDPNLHEAIAQVDSDAVAPGAVVTQHQPGYTLHGRLIRPAMVTVNARKAGEPG